MDKVAGMRAEERAEIFSTTAQKLGLSEAAVEKDFWVCWVLKKIFEDKDLSKQLIFKGGTTLSKCFHLIERFSEDIDLILDWLLLTDTDPYEERSNTQQDKFNKKMERNAQDYICKQLMPIIRQALGKGCSISIHQDKPRSVIVEYPKAFQSKYIKPELELEIGPMSALEPNNEYGLKPYCADVLPDIFENPEIVVKVIEAKKTFCDKISILHVEAHRIAGKSQPLRYSRHYYDLYRMINSPVLDEVMADLPLLQNVIKFKAKFYPQTWANYQAAMEGKFKLIPSLEVQKRLEKDYAQMEEMIFGEYPAFEKVMSAIKSFENQLNKAFIK